MTFDSSGNPTGQNQTYYYSLGGSLLGAFEVNGSASTTNYFLSDSLGSVLATITNTASSASVQGNQLYDPYGSSRYQSGSMTTSKGFTGQYNDNLTGLDYYGSRYYDPAAGVFLSADPVVGDLAGANPYEYVNANPETNTDPSGQRVISPGGQQGPLGPINVDNVPPAWIQDMQSNAAGVLRNVKDLNLQPDACNAGCKTVLAALVPHDLPGGGPGSFAGGGRCLASPGFISAGPLGAVLVGSPGGGCIPGGGNAEPPSSSPSSRPSITFWQVVPYTLCTGGYDCSDENGGKNKSGEPGGARESGNLLAADAGEEGNVGNVGGDQAPPETPTARPVNKNGDPYPNVIDPRTGNPMPFPEGQLQWVSAVDRVEWTNETRGAFIKEWIEGGYPDYGKEGWRALDIHHILPREYGGTNDFWNLIPVDRSVHQGPAPDGITSWWNAFEP